MSKTHYIGMAGMRGCMPNYCGVYASHSSAAESLADLHDLGKKRRRALHKHGWLDLNLGRDGNEYVSVDSCDCNSPWDHDEASYDDRSREELLDNLEMTYWIVEGLDTRPGGVWSRDMTGPARLEEALHDTQEEAQEAMEDLIKVDGWNPAELRVRAFGYQP